MDGRGDSILDAIYEEENLNDEFQGDDDIEMVDVEEGELVESNTSLNENALVQSSNTNNGGDATLPKQEPRSKNRRRREKKKNKRKRMEAGSNVMDINRFVLDTCRRLREKKSYLVYAAIGCLGVSALSDIIKEVDAVQACGGQMTADGKRFRSGGGILWSILKAREPRAYKEIMKKGKEFEKQLRHPKSIPSTECKVGNGMAAASCEGHEDNVETHPVSEMQNLTEGTTQGKRSSVYERLRVPVSYDDDLLGELPKMTPEDGGDKQAAACSLSRDGNEV